MFATSGYFRAIPCPFYLNGLCERPFCHFRHTRQDSEKTKDDVPSYSTSGVRSNSPVDFGAGTKPYAAQQAASDDSYFTSSESPATQSTAPKSSTELLQAGIEQSFAIPSFTDSTTKYPIPSADEEPEQYMTASPEKKIKREKSALQSKYPLPETDDEATLPAYLPTPKTPSLPPASSKLSSSVPEYQPTPKRELKRRNGDPRRVADMEYDPESNFSCGGLSNNHSANDDSLEYKPTHKKAKLMGRSSRLSCDSLKECSADGELSGFESDEDDDEGPPDGEFSDDELEPQPDAEKMQDDNISEDFGNIDDDDISSDDDLIEVASIPATQSGNKKILNGHAKTHVSSKTSNSASSKSCAQQHVRKNSSEKSSKSIKNSHSNESSKSHSSEKPKGKSSGRHSASSASSTHNKSSSSKSPSSSKHDSSKKPNTSTKDRHTSSSSNSVKTEHSSLKKTSPSDRKSHSSTAAVKKSSSSSAKRDSTDSRRSSRGKHTGSGSSHSSSASVSKASSSHSKVNSKDGKRRDSTSEKSVSLDKKVSRSDSYIESGGFLGGVQTTVPETHRLGAVHKNESVNKRKSSTENFASVKRTSSTENSASAGRRNSTDKQKSSKPDSSSLNLLKKPIMTKQEDVKHGSDKTHGMISSVTDNDDHRFHDSVITNSSPQTSPTKHTQLKQENKKGSGKHLLHRMNSSLFGEDTSDNEDMDFPNDDIYGQESLSAPVDGDPGDVDLSNFIHDSDFEEEDTFDECLRIFKEGAAQLGTTSKKNKQLTKDGKGTELAAATESAVGKKRVAHSAADQALRSEVKKERPRQHLSAAQVMHNRIMEMQRRALERAAKQAVQEQKVSSTSGTTPKSTSALASTSTSQGQSQGGDKKRVAHTPKPPTPSPSTSKEKSVSVTKIGGKTVTIATTASKTEKRIAHAPNLSNLKRPVIPASFGSKVPSNIRQRYLNLIIDECLKFCPSEEEAYKKGLEEETGVYDRATNKNIYLRVAVNTITRLRSEAKDLLLSEPSSSTLPQRRLSNAQSHQATIGGSRAAKTSFTLHRSSSSGKKIEVALTRAELYEKLSKYCLTEEQLIENGYPRPSPDAPGKAVCHGTKYKDTDTLLKGNERTCARCGTRFMVQGNGTYVNQEECVYHWTRAYPRKKSGFIQHIYNCCNSDTSSKGCQIASNHVHEKNKQDSLTGFMRTMPHSPPRDGNYGVYALDCEMVYTLGGLELARVTVVDTEGKSVYESLVQPFNSIVDYNSRFSGLTQSDLKDVKTTLTDVQAILLSMFSDKTILIGHSLESDLFALKLIHSTVVDTSVCFPHRLGPPYKRALKNLMLETFQKIIQSDDGGHDSKEDAVACLDLMKWRIKEDSRRENRYS